MDKEGKAVQAEGGAGAWMGKGMEGPVCPETPS